MITANKGRTKIEGLSIDIIYEFNSIISAMQENTPEIVIGIITAWSSILEEKLDDVSKEELSIIAHMSEDFIKSHMESEDNND